MPILDFNDPNPGFGGSGGGGGASQTFDTVDDLVAAHAAQPLAPGTVWRSNNPLLFGTVEEGQLVPDPFDPTSAPDPLFTRTTQARVVRRGLTPDYQTDFDILDLEGT